MNKYLLIVISLVLFAFSLNNNLVLAHHSFVAHYVEDTDVEISGLVTEFWFENPHVRILLDVESSDGETEQWIAETGARNVFIRRGWSGGEIKPGDFVEIVGNASRDGSNTTYVQALKLPNGEAFRSGAGGLIPDSADQE